MTYTNIPMPPQTVHKTVAASCFQTGFQTEVATVALCDWSNYKLHDRLTTTRSLPVPGWGFQPDFSIFLHCMMQSVVVTLWKWWLVKICSFWVSHPWLHWKYHNETKKWCLEIALRFTINKSLEERRVLPPRFLPLTIIIDCNQIYFLSLPANCT